MRYPTLRKHVDTLVMDLSKRDALQIVYRAEDHAKALHKEAEAHNGCVCVSVCVSVCVFSVREKGNEKENTFTSVYLLMRTATMLCTTQAHKKALPH